MLNTENTYELNTGTIATPVWSPLADGITTVDAQINDEVDTKHYYSGEGHSDSDVVGTGRTFSFSGDMIEGDVALEYIMSKKFSLSTDRVSQLRVTYANGDVLTETVTIANIQGPGGEAAAKSAISFDLLSKGKPTFVAAP